MEIVEKLIETIESVQTSLSYMQKDAIKKKPLIRIRFYTILIDYINSPGVSSPNNFFSWYLERLDDRMELMQPSILFMMKLFKKKNEAGFRKFLEDCNEKTTEDGTFFDYIRDWIPDDEYRILTSSSASDMTPVLKMVIEMCEDKAFTQKQIMESITGNIPIVIVGLVMHWVLFSFLYGNVTTPGFEERTTWEAMTIVERNYLRYTWISSNFVYVIIGLVAIVAAFKWSIKNWSNRLIFIREKYIDFLPPYSLARVSEQYNILMILSSFLKSGSSFSESLKEVKKGGSPYVQYQVQKILDRDDIKANDALGSFYLGSFGADVRERANHIPLERAISDLLPRIKIEKRENFDKIVKITLMVSFKPLIYFSLGYSVVPVLFGIFDSLPKT